MFRRRLGQIRLSNAMIAIVFGLTLTAGHVDETLADFPERPVTLVVGFSAGGGTDTYARTLAGLIHESLGVPMVVVNKPGAAGMIAANFVQEQPADGYTLYMASAGSFLVKHMYDPGNAPVDPLSDMKPIGGLGASIPGLFVPTDSAFESAADLVAHARKNPGALRWSHPGRGSLFQLTGVAFLQSNGIEVQDVPFKGGSKARGAVAASQVDFGFMGVQLGKGFETKMRAIGVAGAERDPENPDVPTFQEQQLEIVKLINPQMIMAANSLPDDIAETLTAAIEATVTSETYGKLLSKAGLTGFHLSPDEGAAMLQELKQTLEPIVSDVRS